jgi:hypothetical protein
MTKQIRGLYVDEFVVPGVIKVSAEALKYAGEFAVTVGSRFVTVFDWAQDIGIRDNANAPLRKLGPCMLLGALDRGEVPPEFIQRAIDFEFAIQIPEPIWQERPQRLIDFDESEPFRLTLR